MNFPYERLIFKNENKPLSSIPFHKDVPCIERFFSDEFPFHLAIHHITNANGLDEDYTNPHIHDDLDEINIIVGKENELEYKIQLGEEEFDVSSNSTIWIPAGVKHSANVIKGDGYFIAIRMDATRFNKEYMQTQFNMNFA
ncbi:cupin domain-containing protein [Shouchella miscanthi]|uniref:cupin domain-containing protein n=1 Tax=Shouchella miscanthi TaxID=2598861 RepID=UPI0011A84B36|nr:hypothetical protein [Shouchella miscanthi]